MGAPVGDDFQKETKYIRNQGFGGSLDWSKKPETYKSYPNSKTVKLPSELKETTAAFTEIIQRRKSTRAFSTQPLTKSDLAFLLWVSTGIQRIEHGYEFRMAPSAGALYPVETYVAVNHIEGLDKGIYHYNIKDHSLEEVKAGNFGDALAHAALDQTICAIAPVVIIWSAVFNRSKWKYSQRAYRYIYLDAGHIAQNLTLAATSISCGSCQVGAFFDDEINSILALDGAEESVIYLSVVGHPK
ncbi:MAG TPA: SagB/ThcOx family dehydrogenase [Candidatus Acidoferrum sp.]|nr:SagB/ThcOx family dehydrogenase [Candidatus Acidoferrum sp.]